MTTDVDVVVVDLDAAVDPVSARCLSADERARATRYRFDTDRDRFAAGRIALRQLLGDRIGVDPGAVEFVYGSEGKPGVAHGIEFNVANSAGIAIVALSSVELGCDLELLRPGFADDEIAERYFAPAETERLRVLPLPAQELAFFRCWTRKESVLKAHGGGLQVPLDSFTVQFTTEAPPSVTWVRDDPTEAARWTLLDCSAAVVDLGVQDAVAAIAARAPIRLRSIAVHDPVSPS